MIRTQERTEAIGRFLARAGWGRARREVLAGDASFRRYDRLTLGGRTAVLMDAPPPQEDIRPFVHVARLLVATGLSAPEILAADEEAGFLLLEDLGDDKYSRVLAEGGDEAPLYEAAVDALAHLHRQPAPADLPPFDEEMRLREALLFTDWFMPLAGLDIPAAARESYIEAWRDLFPVLDALPRHVVLLDYHADNLVWLPRRAGVARVGQLDFQDAVLGPVVYDLVSLLEDARRDVASATVEACRARYLDTFPELDPEAFDAAWAVHAAQRNAKIVGIFCRLLTRDGKPGYQDYLPRVWGHLASDLAHPATAPLAAWMDRWVPVGARTRAA